jgi:hypothetical protein
MIDDARNHEREDILECSLFFQAGLDTAILNALKIKTPLLPQTLPSS